jgi:hypothetical protein
MRRRSEASQMADRRVILSLGAGVQSTTLALMAARGDLSPGFPQPMAAVFADTGWEPASVYRHLRWLITAIGSTLPIRIVRAMRPDGTPAHIREDSEALVRGDTNRLANPPLFVKESVEYTAYPDPEQQTKFETYLIRRGEIPRFVTMPVFAREFTGARPVMLRRQCTGDYKLEPIYRFCRPLIGRRRGQRHNTPPFCEMWIGISAEENARRCTPSHEGWVTNRYPLRELGMTRVDCVSWLWEHYQIVVPKSACVGCLMWNFGRGRPLPSDVIVRSPKTSTMRLVRPGCAYPGLSRWWTPRPARQRR